MQYFQPLTTIPIHQGGNHCENTKYTRVFYARTHFLAAEFSLYDMVDILPCLFFHNHIQAFAQIINALHGIYGALLIACRYHRCYCCCNLFFHSHAILNGVIFDGI